MNHLFHVRRQYIHLRLVILFLSANSSAIPPCNHHNLGSLGHVGVETCAGDACNKAGNMPDTSPVGAHTACDDILCELPTHVLPGSGPLADAFAMLVHTDGACPALGHHTGDADTCGLTCMHGYYQPDPDSYTAYTCTAVNGEVHAEYTDGRITCNGNLGYPSL